MSEQTDTKDKIIVGGAIVGGLLFFGFLASTCKNPLSITQKNNDFALANPGDTLEDYKTRITGLENDVKALEDNSADEATIADLNSQIKDSQIKSSDLQAQLDKALKAPTADTASLKSQILQLTGVNEKLIGDNKQAESTILDLTAKLKNGASAMALAKAADAGSETNADAADQANMIEQLKTENEKLSTDLLSLSDSLKKAKEEAEKAAEANTGEGSAMEGKISDLTKQNQELKAKLASDGTAEGNMDEKLKALAKMAADQKAQLAVKNGEIANLSAQVNQLKAAKNVFVKSADDLPKTAQALFTDLKSLEGTSSDQLNGIYDGYVGKHNASSKLRVKFRSGSSSISSADKAKIAELTKNAGENAYFLIVGFADKSGDAAGNKRLSSKRSTNVAQQLSNNAKGFQAAQAVYLGQTDRFGPAAENRVVEIWEIK